MSEHHRLGGWLRSHIGILVLVLVPFVVVGAPLVVHHVLLGGDNLIQNYPMRVLVGIDLRHGELPLWNPYLFSGTPLLAGFNAGAAYPTTWLFALLSGPMAWTFTLALGYEVAVVGVYALARHWGLVRPAAVLAAATYAFGGYQVAQIVHVDLVIGAGWLPWLVLATWVMTEPGPRGIRPSRRVVGWGAVFALALGLSLLSGGAEAIIDSATLIVIVAVVRLVQRVRQQRQWTAALSSIVHLAAASVVGVLLGAAQWLPGLAFLASSHRAQSSYGFFTSGDLPPRSLALWVSPFLLGTNRLTPAYYSGPYNYPEVSGYVGVVALIAALALLGRRWRRHATATQWWVWYLVAALGVLFALGGATPMGHLLFEIPGIKSERLLNRNLLLVDFSLAMLVGWWIHLEMSRDRTRSSLRHRRTPGLLLLPAIVSTIFTLSVWLDGNGFQGLLGANFQDGGGTLDAVRWLATGSTLIAWVATWIVRHLDRWRPQTWVRAVSAVMAVDLAFFAAFTVQTGAPISLVHVEAPAATTLRALTGSGRFLVFDPDEFLPDELQAFGQTDLNILDSLPSAQGYSALTLGSYFEATGAHYQEDLNAATFAGDTWDRLNATTLLTLPTYFLTPVAEGGSGGSAIRFPPASAVPTGGPFVPEDDITLQPGRGPQLWYTGAAVPINALRVPGSTSRGARWARCQWGVLLSTRRTRWLQTSSCAAATSITLAHPLRTAAVEVRVTGRRAVTLSTPEIDAVSTGWVTMNGELQGRVASPHWTYLGTVGSFGAFRNTRAKGRGWFSDDRGVVPHADATTPWGQERIIVYAGHPDATFTRSEVYAPGWEVDVRHISNHGAAIGPVDVVPVAADPTGLLQQVTIPQPGLYRLTFTYRPARDRLGILVSGVTAIGLGLWGLWFLVRRRRYSEASSPTADAARA